MSKILICVAVYDTIDNKRTKYTKECFKSLMHTIDVDTTDVVFIDNGSCDDTKKFLKQFVTDNVHIIYNKENKGTAYAINQGIQRYANPGDYIIKLDNDVTFGRYGWADEMKSCIEADPKIGILGLKRKDLPNSPDHETYKTILKFLPHKLGERWNIIEECSDIIGTCTMFNPKLMEKIGYLYQPGIYGFDDVLMCYRSLLANFYNAFYPSVEIEHLDDGKTPFTQWKRDYAGIYINEIDKIKEEYRTGIRPIYYNPFQ